MGRRKMPEGTRKVVAAISLDPSAKEMLFAVADARGITASALVEEYVKKEYLKLKKAGKCRDVGIPGQIQLPVESDSAPDPEQQPRRRAKKEGTEK